MNKIRIYTLLIITALIFKSIVSMADVTKIAGSAATGVVLQQLFADLNTMIETARNEGEYLLAKAGVEAKDALEAWRSANEHLLNTAFKEIEEANQALFSRAHGLVFEINTGVGDNLEKAQQITENANLIAESIGNASYVIRYLPRIVPPQAEETFTLRIRGVNLDRANPVLKLSSTNAKRDLPGPLEAQFTIPISEIPRDASKILLKTFPLHFTTSSDSWLLNILGKRNQEAREITVVSLPEIMAKYEISGERTFSDKEVKPFTRDLGQFKAKNNRQYKIAKPDSGWKWDLSKPLIKYQGKGESGRCEGVDDNKTSENGVSFFAHLDEINKLGHAKKPGYVNCKLSGTLYRIVSKTEDFPKQSGSLSWIKDKAIALPVDMSSFDLKIITFDGRERLFKNPGADRFFDVKKNKSTLVITPKVPTDLLN